MRDLSSPARDQTCAPCSGRAASQLVYRQGSPCDGFFLILFYLCFILDSWHCYTSPWSNLPVTPWVFYLMHRSFYLHELNR